MQAKAMPRLTSAACSVCAGASASSTGMCASTQAPPSAGTGANEWKALTPR